MTGLTFAADGTAVLTGLAIEPQAAESVFVVEVDQVADGKVPVTRLTADSGFLTVTTDTGCDGRTLGLSAKIPGDDPIERAPHFTG